MNSVVRNTGKLFLIVAAFYLLGMPAFARGPKIALDLEGLDPDVNVDVIVQFTQTPSARLHAKVLDLGGELKSELGIVRAEVYRMPAGKLEELADDPEVAARRSTAWESVRCGFDVSPDNAVALGPNPKH